MPDRLHYEHESDPRGTAVWEAPNAGRWSRREWCPLFYSRRHRGWCGVAGMGTACDKLCGCPRGGPSCCQERWAASDSSVLVLCPVCCCTVGWKVFLNSKGGPDLGASAVQAVLLAFQRKITFCRRYCSSPIARSIRTLWRPRCVANLRNLSWQRSTVGFA